MCLICYKAAGMVETSAETGGNFAAGSESAESYMQESTETAAETASLGFSGVGAGALATLLLAWAALTVGLAKGTQFLSKLH